jgi:hypothetical protein
MCRRTVRVLRARVILGGEGGVSWLGLDWIGLDWTRVWMWMLYLWGGRGRILKSYGLPSFALD